MYGGGALEIINYFHVCPEFVPILPDFIVWQQSAFKVENIQ